MVCVSRCKGCKVNDTHEFIAVGEHPSGGDGDIPGEPGLQ
jgi:hypothetical protein